MPTNFIDTEVTDFKVNAYHAGELTEVTKQDTLGKWGVYFFYPADFSFVCPTELGDLADHYAAFTNINAEIYSVSEVNGLQTIYFSHEIPMNKR